MSNRISARFLPDKIEWPSQLPDTPQPAQIKARMDLTRTTRENADHWKDADALSARAAYPRSERKTARERSRHAAANNCYYAGMLRTAANHIIGTGPRLQVTTDNEKLNTRIQQAWQEWVRQIGLNQKLKTMVETYWRDGEVFGMRGQSFTSDLGLELRLYEGDQIQQPYTRIYDYTLDDGLRVDQYTNSIETYVLDHHPGDIGIGVYTSPYNGKWYPAKEMFHLFRAERPGQTRGIPRCSPGIDFLEHIRRFSKATLSAAELVANMPYFVKTNALAQSDYVSPPRFMPQIGYERGVLNFLPELWELVATPVNQPTTTFEMYQRVELMYFARCANMPYLLAAGTSKDSNFASAKMDIKNIWEPEVRSEQDTITNVVLVKLFRWFLDESVLSDLLDDWPGTIADITFKFHWPPLPQSDEIDVANAAVIRMTNGLTTPRQEALARGEDYDQKVIDGAADYGVTPEEYRRAMFAKHFGVSGTPGGTPAAGGGTPDAADTPAPMSAGAFVGTKRRDFSNNLKQQNEVLDQFSEGGSETQTKQALMRLGLSEHDAYELMDEYRSVREHFLREEEERQAREEAETGVLV